MASGDLVQDPQPNLSASSHRTVPGGREYEFAFPLKNASPGNTAWERDRSYQIALLVGPTKDFTGITQATWMSDQVLIRIGSRSTASIYRPPLTGPAGTPGSKGGGHGH
ncbi:MAG: hypothetical protein HY724_11925 [Candidatus Rokubacteria bacterium]|nr:hypothetical protein [Candidatus Rokubacteria bacterium]